LRLKAIAHAVPPANLKFCAILATLSINGIANAQTITATHSGKTTTTNISTAPPSLPTSPPIIDLAKELKGAAIVAALQKGGADPVARIALADWGTILAMTEK
jgi:hypothetical protein